MTLSKLAGVLFFLLAPIAHAQFSKPEIELTEENRYLFPIRPGSPASLAGTMGELRSTHFHTGIDIRTNSEIGWPVVAAQSGYISRAGVSRTGYGLVLYVKHPDGNSTVYGHLDRFHPKLHKHILQERYNRKESEVELSFTENQFPVKKGDTIAFAGNTGASQGPHLHFDIRDANNQALNPLLYNFTEVRDNTPPIATRIAFKTLDINSRINDKFGRQEFYLQRSGKDYLLTQTILAHGKIGLEILAHDIVDNARFKCGVNYIEVWVDSVQLFTQHIQQLNVAQGRTIYSLMDFRKMQADGSRYYRLYKEEGTPLNFYEQSPGTGVLNIREGQQVAVRIVMKDFHGNTSQVKLKLRHSNPVKELPTLQSAKVDIATEIDENTFMMSVKPCPEGSPVALVHAKGTVVELEPTYLNEVKAVYLIDLRTLIPDSIQVCDRTHVTNLKALVPSKREYRYYSNRIDIRFPERALLDTLYLTAEHLVKTDSQEVFSLGPVTAFGQSIEVTLKPVRSYTTDSKTAVYRKRGRSYSFEGGDWTSGRITFYPRELGDFVILRDTIPPGITRIYANNQAVRFKISDNLS
ncbi:MAG: M23 family metallopeptidase, partial [Cyclobacteriaceae bacterium]|nr:M23 family metallopeptidase [Cyclobacteriaceae bacterium]